MRVTLSARAEVDLAHVFAETLDRWGEAQARRYAEQIERRLALLARGATMGLSRPELGDGVRSLPAGSHILFFKVYEDEVLVLSVRHARRRPPSDLT